MAEATVVLTTGQLIENALVAEGRKKIWLVNQIKEIGAEKEDELLRHFSDVKLSRRLNGHEPFENNLIKVINKVLKTKIEISE